MNHDSPQRPFSMLERCALGLLIAWLALHGFWRFLDHTPPMGDRVGYTLGAVKILQALPTSLLEIFHQLDNITETQIRPPGASLLLAPWMALSGSDITIANWAMVLWYGATFLCIFLLGRKCVNQQTGLLGAVFFITLPLVYGIEIDPEVTFMTLTPLTLWLCLEMRGQGDLSQSHWGWWLAMGSVTALGLLLKWLFMIPLLGPMLVMLAAMIHDGYTNRLLSNRRLGSRYALRFTVMLAPVVLVAMLWYWPNRDELMQAFSHIAKTKQFTPFKNGWTWSVPFFYLNDFFIHNKIVPTLFALIGLVVWLLPWKSRNVFERNLLYSSIVGFWLYFTVRYENIPLKYLYPMLPIVSIVSVAWLTRIRYSWLRHGLCSLLLVYAFACAGWLHFGQMSWLGSSPLPRKNPIGIEEPWKHYSIPSSIPPHCQEWPFNAIATSIKKHVSSATASGSLVVLPDLYYLNWRNFKPSLRNELPNFRSHRLRSHNGLIRLYQLDWLLSSRGTVSRLPYPVRLREPSAQTTVDLARLIDRAPPWFWKHYCQVDTFEVPYIRSKLQLYRRTKPHSVESTAELCNFWITGHEQDQAVMWKQIKALWQMQKCQIETARAQAFLDYFNAPLPHNAERFKKFFEIEAFKSATLFSYELYQLGLLALESGLESSAHEYLSHSVEQQSSCSWKAAFCLGEWHEQQNQLDQARVQFQSAWRLQRGQVAPIQGLQRIDALQQDSTINWNKIANLTVEIQNNNRRPNLYREVATLLSEPDYASDALWYTHQGWVVGLNRLPVMLPLVQAMKRAEKTLPHLEMMRLPVHNGFLNADNHAKQRITMFPGETHVFPFLNLPHTEEGTYLLHWEMDRVTPTLKLALHLDGAVIGESEFRQSEHTNLQRGEFRFTTSGGDRLRITCMEGEANLSRMTLERIGVEIPLRYQGMPNFSTLWVSSISPDFNGGYFITPDESRTQIDFPYHADQRAWDEVVFGASLKSGASLPPSKLTLFVKDENTGSIPLIIHSQEGENSYPIPIEATTYPFLIKIRWESDSIQAGDALHLQSLRLQRHRTGTKIEVR